MSKEYKDKAREFGCRFRVGKYGFRFFAKDPDGRLHKILMVIPLNGWITSPMEVWHEMKDRDFEL